MDLPRDEVNEGRNDPFRAARERDGVLGCEFQGERIPMILRHEEVREAAKDWQRFSSAAPFRVPIPSEEEMRTVRQYPIEVDPPDHGEYRKIVEPFFKRPREPWFAGRIEALTERLLDGALARDSVEVVNDFAIPLQSRALTHLLGVEESEAEIWIGWGMHVFKGGGGEGVKGAALEAYIRRRLERAAAEPGEDFFSALNRAEFQGRPLTSDERVGFANLTFAGGRDTVIHSISSIIAYLAEHPQSLAFLREDPKRIVHAGEEFFRFITPLTHIGRVCPEAGEVRGMSVPSDGRVSLCWASANRDGSVFDAPDEVRLDRRPNPHLAFGFGPHLCLGAAHARLIVRVLLERLSQRIGGIEVLAADPNVENEAAYRRQVGYHSLTVRMLRPDQRPS